MKYRRFIEDNFLIDEPKSGQLIPFKFNPVQELYYKELVALGIEKDGVSLALREFIVKARREGFSSLILALFAADDILQSNPTESLVVSYKDDATAVFRKRYRRYILSWYARKVGVSVEDIQADPNTLEKLSRNAFSVDATDLELRHNQAHFYCGTASARTGGRGGVLQKLLFSEAAHYPDSEKMTAKEVIEGTAQQVDKASGWIFQESTGNGQGNHFYKTYELIVQGLSRYALRFYGWRSFYTEEQFKVIASEFTDADMLKQEYPESVDEAFLSSNLSFTSREEMLAMVGVRAGKQLVLALEMQGVNYIDQCETIRDFLKTYVQTNPHRSIYVGLDTAKDTDKTTLTILKEEELSTSAGIKCIAIDSTGQGDFVPDWFARNTNWHVLRVKFSRPTKSVMYKNLLSVIKMRLTKLPEFMFGGKEFLSDEWKHLYKQMLALQKEIIGEMLVVHHPNGSCKSTDHDYDNCPHHDDWPDSWCLAEWGYVSLNGLPSGSRPPEEKSSFDSSVRRLLDNKNRGGFNAGGGDDFM
jgi:hypothetical protein